MRPSRRTFLKGAATFAAASVLPLTYANRCRASVVDVRQVGWFRSSLIVSGFVNSPEFQQNLVDPYGVIARFSSVFLGRAISWEDLDFWYRVAVSGATWQAGWEAVAKGFIDSSEYVARRWDNPTEQVEDLYLAFLGRPSYGEGRAWLPYLAVHEARVEPASFEDVARASRELNAAPTESHPLGPAVIVLAAAHVLEGAGIAFHAADVLLPIGANLLRDALKARSVMLGVGAGLVIGTGVGVAAAGIGTIILGFYIGSMFLNAWPSVSQPVLPMFKDDGRRDFYGSLAPGPGPVYAPVPVWADTSPEVNNPTGGWGWYL